MKRKKNKKGNKIIREMKQCFRDLHLPVENVEKGESYDFKSKIDNDNTVARILVEYRPDCNCANISFSLGVTESGNYDEIRKLANLINGITPFSQYSLCPCCNEIILHASLFVSNHELQNDKFSWLLRYMLEIAHLANPAISALIIMGGSAEKYYDICKDNIRNVTCQEQGLNKEMEENVLNHLVSVFADLDITITDESRIEHGFVLPCAGTSELDSSIIVIMVLDPEESTIIIHAVSSFAVPDDKMTSIVELVNRINRLCGNQHLFVDSQSKKCAFLHGIRLENGLLPKEEFLNVFRGIIANVLCWFPLLQELIMFGGVSSDLIRKRIPCYNDKTTIY